MESVRIFREAQDFVEKVTTKPVAERIESQAAQRRLRQMQAKKEKDARKQKAKAGA